MKKFLFLAMAFGLAACSVDEANDVKSGTDGNGIQQYLSVNLVPAPVNTRAEGETQIGDPDDAIYEEGYTEENTVKAVRFYFFDEEGKAAAVKADGKNYFDWAENIESDGDNMPNVEKLLQAVVVIETPEGDKLPAKIAAVINPATEELGDDELSLEDLRKRTKDYVAAISATTNSGFVMMNAVYANGATEVTATDVTSKNYAPSPEAAKANPVNIYVERNVAKVRVKFDDSFGVTADNHRIALKDKDGNDIKVTVDGEEKQVYLELGNWNLTAYTDKGYLSKHIEAEKWSTAVPFANWNWAPYFRSYWAVNTDEAEQKWISYNAIADGGQDYGSTDNKNIIYTNENAPQTKVEDSTKASSYADFTKVIIAGTLVDEDGEPVDITRYAGIMSAGESNLVKAMLTNLTTGNSMIYTETDDDSFRSLGEKDVKFVTAVKVEQAEEAEDDEGGRYYVYLQLTEDAAKLNWSRTDNKDTYEDNLFANDAAVNQYLIDNLGKAQVYNGGLTYYYFPIRHLATEETSTGYYGVVRNHIYDCNITELVGLGTPVYDPEETIYPEHPSEDDTYIAARINILSWRLVSQDTELKW